MKVLCDDEQTKMYHTTQSQIDDDNNDYSNVNINENNDDNNNDNNNDHKNNSTDE